MTLYNVSAGTASGVVGFSLVTDRPTATTDRDDDDVTP